MKFEKNSICIFFYVWKMEEVHYTGFICKLLETKIMQVLRFKHGQVYRTNKRDVQDGLCDVMLQSLLQCMSCSGFSLYFARFPCTMPQMLLHLSLCCISCSQEQFLFITHIVLSFVSAKRVFSFFITYSEIKKQNIEIFCVIAGVLCISICFPRRK